MVTKTLFETRKALWSPFKGTNNPADSSDKGFSYDNPADNSGKEFRNDNR
jgi:hypothetical protein